MSEYTIGQLAELTGVSRRMLRFYDEIGLIVPERRDNGYRVYTDEHVPIVEFVKDLRDSGISLKVIQQLLEIKHSSSNSLELYQRILKLLEAVEQDLFAKRQQIDQAIARIKNDQTHVQNLMDKEYPNSHE